VAQNIFLNKNNAYIKHEIVNSLIDCPLQDISAAWI